MPRHHKMVAAARQLRGETQQDLADRLKDQTGDPDWTRNRVASIENGRRKFTVEDALAIAEAQDMEISWYLEPPRVASQKRPLLDAVMLGLPPRTLTPLAAA